jgi:hypothetical protein
VINLNGVFQRFYSVKQELVKEITEFQDAEDEIPFD